MTIKDSSLRVLAFNNQARAVLGLSVGMRPREFSNLVHRGEWVERGDLEVLNTMAPIEYVIPIYNREGREEYWLAYKFPIHLRRSDQVYIGTRSVNMMPCLNMCSSLLN